MAQVIEKTGAGEGNRTLVISLEGCCSTIELHPRTFTAGPLINLSYERRSNCLPQGAPGHEQVREAHAQTILDSAALRELKRLLQRR